MQDTASIGSSSAPLQQFWLKQLVQLQGHTCTYAAADAQHQVGHAATVLKVSFSGLSQSISAEEPQAAVAEVELFGENCYVEKDSTMLDKRMHVGTCCGLSSSMRGVVKHDRGYPVLIASQIARTNPWWRMSTTIPAGIPTKVTGHSSQQTVGRGLGPGLMQLDS